MKLEIEDSFPLSKLKSVEGSRHLAREKALQILNAYFVSESPIPEIFPHIFSRRFNFDDEANNKPEEGRLLKNEEVYELEADIPINWKDEEIKYARLIIETLLQNLERFETILIENSQNWDKDRIALIDKILIYIAATEMISENDVPIRVSVNEAIDLGKKYSTDKSSIFINGVLEAFITELIKQNLISQKKIDERDSYIPAKKNRRNKKSENLENFEK